MRVNGFGVLSISGSDTISSDISSFTILKIDSIGHVKMRFISTEDNLNLSGSKVTSWNNKISNNFNAYQNNEFRKPDFVENIFEINNYNGLNFDGTVPSVYNYLQIDSFHYQIWNVL